MPDAYRIAPLDQEENGRVRAMTGLLRSGLLKRFESSCFAFRETIRKMVRQHDQFLEALEKGHIVTTAFLQEQEVSGDDEILFEDLLKKHSEDVADARDFDVTHLKHHVSRDRDLLQSLEDSAASISNQGDAKLRALSDVLCEIATQAEYEASDAIDEAQKRKVLIFSSFADTVKWIWDFLKQELKNRPELSPYQGRLAAVSGSQEFGGVSKNKAVLGFAPVSMQATAGADTDRFDILITTDILAEGVNLQQCRHIINYDVPWNPMRLVQRHGRIDRINSPHNRVFLRTIFPTDRLDELLNLESRILGKLAMAAASVGVSAALEEGAHGDQVFTETRQEIENLLREDPSLFERGGTVAAAQTGEEYRQMLRKAHKELGEEIAKLPWKVGSGMRKGRQRGLFFCAVIGHDSDYERTYLRFIPATSDWKPTGGRESIIHELGTCLRMIECEENTPTWYPDGFHEYVYDFWDIAQTHILDHWMRETDPANLQPKVERINHQVAEFIRKYPPRDIDSARTRDALDILESPWPRREQNRLRTLFKSREDLHQPERHSPSHDLVEYVMETGIERSQPPPPLPLIDRDDIKLLCWLAIESENDNGML
ncbi:MAG: SWF/SNF helicase family protein [Rhodothermaceae bacterium]|nr:SWF/SNF helicase family protein [Rhodothermaceae bacterium]